MLTVLYILLLLTAATEDIFRLRISNITTLGGFVLLFALLWIDSGILSVNYLISAFSAFSLLAVISFLSRGKLGMGDAKFALSVGGFLGFYHWLVSLLAASLLALLILIPLLLRGRSKEKPIPFGPFLAMGALISLWMKKEALLAF